MSESKISIDAATEDDSVDFMEYIVHFGKVETGSGRNRVGLEIQPPLHESAHQGVLDALTTKPGGVDKLRTSSDDTIANQAYMTRHDDEGTAFVTELNPRVTPDAFALAHAIGTLINPCGLHTVILQEHLEDS